MTAKKNQAKRTIKSKERQMDGSVELKFTQKKQNPIRLSQNEADKHNVGEDFEPNKAPETDESGSEDNK